MATGVILFIQTENIEDSENKTTILVCADENAFEQKVEQYLNDYFDERYGNCHETYLNFNKEEYAKEVLDRLKLYQETRDPNDWDVIFKREYHTIQEYNKNNEYDWIDTLDYGKVRLHSVYDTNNNEYYYEIYDENEGYYGTIYADIEHINAEVLNEQIKENLNS